MSARSRLHRLFSATIVSALIAGAAMLTAPAAFAQTEQIEAPSTSAEMDVDAQTSDVQTSEPDSIVSPESVVTSEESSVPVPVPDPDNVDAAEMTAAPQVDHNEDTGDAVPNTDEETASDDAEQVADVEEADDSAGKASQAKKNKTVALKAADNVEDVEPATLEWGVKSSFRNYLYNIQPNVFKGKTTLLGTTTQPVAKGTFVWAEGTLESEASGDAADVSFGEGNGVHFQSHPMTVGSEEVYALDMQFTNPHVVVTSATTGELRLDARGFEFDGMTSVGAPYAFDDAVVADLALSAPTVVDDVWTWTNAAATLTRVGAEAFGGFYAEGEELDPVTFSTGKLATVPEPTISETTTVLTASSSSVTVGETTSLAAKVNPSGAAGNVSFFDGQTLLKKVNIVDGVATYSTAKLAPGTHAMTAVFVPADTNAFAGSTSAVVSVKVSKKAAAAPEKMGVKNATLSWGFKASFRDYIYKMQPKVFKGRSMLLGGVKQELENTGVFNWAGGAGKVVAVADPFSVSTSDVTFRANDGVHFQSHPMTVNGKEAYALDLQFKKPHVVVTSATTGELRMDVDGYTFEGMTTIGEKFSFNDKVIATLALPEPTVSGATATWSNATATLTKDGEAAFGKFYLEGDALDPVTFSLPLNYDGDIVQSNRAATSTSLTASATEIDLGKPVTLTSTTKPGVDGTVNFSVPGAGITKTVQASNGTATLKFTGAKALVYTAQATFVPADNEAYSHSVSNALKINVNDPAHSTGTPATNKPGSSSGQGEGSLSWGISRFFSAYTTEKSGSSACPTGSKHCAGGDILTSGVGAGWLFPQAEGSSWNDATQTGTIQYSGSVSFNGYGMTMYQVANPSISVTSATSATLSTGYSGGYGPSSVALDLSAASKSVGSGGEVTWSGVPVQGSLLGISAGQAIGFDSLTFTVGSVSGVSFGATAAGASTKEARTAADTAPTTTGVKVLTDAKKITAGGRIELEATGFDADDEGVLVVLYDGDGANPVVLDEEAVANAAGIVSWSGTLPKKITAKHIITMQGSTDAGAVIDVLKKKSATKKAAAKSNPVSTVEQAQMAGVLGVGTEATVGMSSWEWWVSAGGLAAIAACMSLLVVRQRKLA